MSDGTFLSPRTSRMFVAPPELKSPRPLAITTPRAEPGPTLPVAALAHGRRVIACELSEDYSSVVRGRRAVQQTLPVGELAALCNANEEQARLDLVAARARFDVELRAALTTDAGKPGKESM